MTFKPITHAEAYETFEGAVKIELEKATNKFKEFNSTHEAHSIILEEFEEWWDKVKDKEAHSMDEVDELVQMGAMVFRAFIDCYANRVGSKTGER